MKLVFFFSLAILIAATTGCNKASLSRSQSAGSQAPGFQGSTATDPTAPNFTKIEMQDMSPSLNDGAEVVRGLNSSEGLVLKAETYLNPTDETVILWVKGSGGFNYIWELRHPEAPSLNIADTSAPGRMDSVRITYPQGGTSETRAVSDFTRIPVFPHSSVNLFWIGTSARPSLSDDLKKISTGRQTVHFWGKIEREVRVSDFLAKAQEVCSDLPAPERYLTVLSEGSPLNLIWDGDGPIPF